MTGLRRSEVCGLRWPDVDLVVGMISVRRAAVVVDGRRHVKAPKTAASRSTLFARRAAELGLRPITLRQLRHSHATALLRAGAHPKVVQERLGHSSIRVTLDVCSAVLPNMQREAVERLAHMFDAR